ncbi:hypothetical protein J437_LFUL004808, partial [Ladona fulva]
MLKQKNLTKKREKTSQVIKVLGNSPSYDQNDAIPDFTEVDAAEFDTAGLNNLNQKGFSDHDRAIKRNPIPILLDEAELEKYSRYKMNHGKRGIVLIFNNENFKHPDLSKCKRDGAEEDGKALQATFEGLGFEVRLHKDLVDEVVERFESDRVPSLAGKPKIFLFQACRGTDLGNSSTVAGDFDGTDSVPVKCFSIPTIADFLF